MKKCLAKFYFLEFKIKTADEKEVKNVGWKITTGKLENV